MTAIDTKTRATLEFAGYGDFGGPSTRPIISDSTGAPSTVLGFGDLLKRIHQQVLDQFQLKEFSKLPDDRQKTEIRLVAERLLEAENLPLNNAQRAQMLQDLKAFTGLVFIRFGKNLSLCMNP